MVPADPRRLSPMLVGELCWVGLHVDEGAVFSFCLDRRDVTGKFGGAAVMHRAFNAALCHAGGLW